MPDCPDNTELVQFLNDSLGDDRLAGVSGHVDGCPLCQARLDRLTEQTIGGAARYKGAAPCESSGAGTGSYTPCPDAATQVVGAKPVFPVLAGMPQVPGFEVLAEIGRGGMGVVFKARHRRLNRLVALKMILAGGASDQRAVQRFLFEGEVLARVQHPQVVTVFEVGTYEGPNRAPVPYLAMELLEGGTLSRRLRDGGGAEPRLPPRTAAALLEGLARAVHVAHLQGVVHRDLKPANILFPADGGARAVGGEGDTAPAAHGPRPARAPKVTDFGLAKFTQDTGADLTQSGQIVGTPQYMAPEQASGARTLGPAVDVYALGAILFECLAGRPPFAGTEPMSVMLKVVNEPPPDVRALRPEVHRDLAAVTMRCLAKEPDRRYASAEELADDLRRFLDDRPTLARPVTNLERLWFSAKRNPAVAGLLGALALVLSVAFVAFAALWVRAEERARSEAALKLVAQGASEHAKGEVRERLRHEARLEFARAVEWCEDGRVGDGLALFARAVELAEATGDATLARIARTNIAAWDRDLPRSGRRFQHTEQPRLVAFHPDGRHMASAGRGRELYLWDAATGRRVRTYAPAPGAAPDQMTYWTVAFSPDGRTLAAGGTDAAVTLWEADPDGPAEAAPLAHLPLPRPRAHSGPDGDINLWTMAFTGPHVLWTCDGANGLRRWDLTDPRKPETRQPVPPDGAANAPLQIMAPAADLRLLYTGDRAGRVREWDAATGAERRSWSVKGWVTDVAVSPDGTRLAATGTEGVVTVFDLTGAKKPLEIGLAGAYGNGVAFAPKCPHVAASDGDGNVRFWHRDTGQPVGLARWFHGEVTRMRFRPGSDEFAVPAGDSVYLCRAPDPRGDVLSVGRGVRVRGLDFAPLGDRLVATDEAGGYLFDLDRGGRTPFVADGSGQTVRFDPDPARPRVFRGTRYGFDRFAIPGGARTPGTVFYGAKVLRLEFPRDGASLFTLMPGTVARYDSASLERAAIKRPVEKLPAGVELSALAVRPDGGEVFVSFGDSAVFLKGDTLDPRGEWAIGDEVLDARYTPDGTKLLLGRRSGAAELRDAATGARIGPQMPHKGTITAVAVSPTGALLLTGSRDGTARFWDAATGLPMGGPLVHAGPVVHVAFAPNGRRIATGTGTGHITLWDVPPSPCGDTSDQLRAKFGTDE